MMPDALALRLTFDPAMPLRVTLAGDMAAWRRRLLIYSADFAGRRVILSLTESSQRRYCAALCSAISSPASLRAWCTMLAMTCSASVGAASAAGATSSRMLERWSMRIFRAIMARAGWRVQVTVASAWRAQS